MEATERGDCASCYIRCRCAEAWVLERQAREAPPLVDDGCRQVNEVGGVKTASES